MSSIQKVAVVAVAIIAFIAGSFFSGSKLGGTTNYDDLAVDSITTSGDATVGDDLVVGSASATTSINVGRVCYTITSATGTTFYASYNGAGALATSTTSCN